MNQHNIMQFNSDLHFSKMFNDYISSVLAQTHNFYSSVCETQLKSINSLKAEIEELKCNFTLCSNRLIGCELQLQNHAKVLVCESFKESVKPATDILHGVEERNNNIVIKGLCPSFSDELKAKQAVEELLNDFLKIRPKLSAVNLLGNSGSVIVQCATERDKALIFGHCHLLKGFHKRISIRDDEPLKKRFAKPTTSSDNKMKASKEKLSQSNPCLESPRSNQETNCHKDAKSKRGSTTPQKEEENGMPLYSVICTVTTPNLELADEQDATSEDGSHISIVTQSGLVEYFCAEDAVQDEIADLMSHTESWEKEDIIILNFMTLLNESRDVLIKQGLCFCDLESNCDKIYEFANLHKISNEMVENFGMCYNKVMSNIKQHWIEYYAKSVDQCFCLTIRLSDLFQNTAVEI